MQVGPAIPYRSDVKGSSVSFECRLCVDLTLICVCAQSAGAASHAAEMQMFARTALGLMCICWMACVAVCLACAVFCSFLHVE